MVLGCSPVCKRAKRASLMIIDSTCVIIESSWLIKALKIYSLMIGLLSLQATAPPQPSCAQSPSCCLCRILNPLLKESNRSPRLAGDGISTTIVCASSPLNCGFLLLAGNGIPTTIVCPESYLLSRLFTPKVGFYVRLASFKPCFCLHRVPLAVPVRYTQGVCLVLARSVQVIRYVNTMHNHMLSVQGFLLCIHLCYERGVGQPMSILCIYTCCQCKVFFCVYTCATRGG